VSHWFPDLSTGQLKEIEVPYIKQRAREALEEVPTCSGCGNEIDPDVCHCGDYVKDHGFTGHHAIPMGCDCFRADKQR
jgi:hypothetical protein